MNEIKIPKNAECAVGVCGNAVTQYCPYCLEEYDTPPRKIPSTFYCDEHYIKVVETGNCCFGNEQIYKTHRDIAYDW